MTDEPGTPNWYTALRAAHPWLPEPQHVGADEPIEIRSHSIRLTLVTPTGFEGFPVLPPFKVKAERLEATLTDLIAELRDHPDDEPLDADGRDYLAARAEARLREQTNDR